MGRGDSHSATELGQAAPGISIAISISAVTVRPLCSGRVLQLRSPVRRLTVRGRPGS